MLRNVTLFIVVILSTVVAHAGDATKRPNIVFAFADDWGRYASAYAALKSGTPSDVIKTPHIDRVAKEGVLFTNAFVNAPSCTPCRSSLLSGQYFWRTGMGAILLGATWDPAIPSYPLMLRDKGYHIGYSYKVWGPGTPANAPYGGSATSYAKQGGDFNNFSEKVSKEKDIEAGKKKLLAQVRGNFVDFLAARPAGQPFCYWFGPTNVHRKWEKGSGKKLWGIEPDSLKGKLEAGLPDTPEIREDFSDYLGEAQAFDAGVGELLAELDARGELENTMVVISGDHGVPGLPRGKCNLYDLGAAVSLMIRWPVKVPAGRVVTDFVSLPDLCPTFLEAAGEKPLPIMTGRSLIPVLTASTSGRVDPTRDHVIIGRERHVDKTRPGDLPYPQRAICTDKYLYIRNFTPERWPLGTAPGFGVDGVMPKEELLTENTFVAFADLDASPAKSYLLHHLDQPEIAAFVNNWLGQRPAEELYDASNDPQQLTNVAGNPELAAVKKELSDKLMTILRDSRDPRVVDDPVPYESKPFASTHPITGK